MTKQPRKYTFVSYYDDHNPAEWDIQGRKDQGYAGPGWYFWDETQTICHGPYEDSDIALKEQVRYAASL